MYGFTDSLTIQRQAAGVDADHNPVEGWATVDTPKGRLVDATGTDSVVGAQRGFTADAVATVPRGISILAEDRVRSGVGPWFRVQYVQDTRLHLRALCQRVSA